MKRSRVVTCGQADDDEANNMRRYLQLFVENAHKTGIVASRIRYRLRSSKIPRANQNVN